MGISQVVLPETELSGKLQERLSAFALADPSFNVFKLPPAQSDGTFIQHMISRGWQIQHRGQSAMVGQPQLCFVPSGGLFTCDGVKLTLAIQTEGQLIHELVVVGAGRSRFHLPYQKLFLDLLENQQCAIVTGSRGCSVLGHAVEKLALIAHGCSHVQYAPDPVNEFGSGDQGPVRG
ncbi:hypothetical protein D3C81_1460250 [compost metagenome]